MKINNMVHAIPVGAMAPSSCGFTNNPRIRNMLICIIHARESINLIKWRRYKKAMFPTMIPLIYNANMPLPPTNCVIL